MQNTLRLMRRKTEADKVSFIEYIGEILYKFFKKTGELLIRLIKRIIKEIW